MADLAFSAKMGSAESQAQLGEVYLHGRYGLERVKDSTTAGRWLHKAAAQGYAQAQFNLGLMEIRGQGVANDDALAAEWFRQAAVQGHGAAQYYLGRMYEDGRGVTHDDVEAYLWQTLSLTATFGNLNGGDSVANQKAVATRLTATQIEEAQVRVRNWKPAEKTPDQWVTEGFRVHNQGKFAEALTIVVPQANSGHPMAQLLLALMYQDGNGVAQDDVMAANWLIKAADSGNAAAQCLLAAKYQFGKGVAQDVKKSQSLLTLSADQGFAAAQGILGIGYLTGKWGNPDASMAAKWLTRGAVQGDGDSQFYLAALYARGQGMPQDDIKAYMWFTLSQTYSRDPQLGASAKKVLEGLEKRMSTEQIAEARKRAEAWLPVFEVI